MICENCQNIFRGDLQFSEGKEPGSYVSNWRFHHKTIEDWRKAQREQCQICFKIFLVVRADGGDPLKSLSNFFKYRIHERNGAKSLDFFKSDTHILRLLLIPPKASLSSYLRSTLDQRDIADNTASIQSFSQARSWISTCLENHRDCGRSTSRALYQYYPTRLLDLQPWRSRTDIELRLCTTHKDPPETPYMTLSHCWGTLKCLTLTTLNYKDLETGFKLIELPKTFREAIEITRNLGIRYLWIDALCILQDSHKDWRHEAATMMKVYENSYCNISALGATNSEQGCFFKRHPGPVSRIIVETDWMNEFNQSYDIYPENFWREHVDLSILNGRAWVFQERLLAPRILHYARGQLLWECLELDACETYPDGLPCTDTVERNNLDDGGAILRRWKGVDLDTEALRRRFALEPSKRSMVYNYWRQLVQFYSFCHLTRAEDKLVAISGLAKRVQSCLDDEYLAGLWKGSLPSALLWYADVRCPKRSSSYRAPTWSWASMERGVCYEEEIEPIVEPLEDLDFRRTLTPTSGTSQAPSQVSPGPCRHHPESLEQFIHPVTILATGVDLATTDVTGQVTYGYIHLIGSLIPARIEIDPSPVESERYTVHLQMLPHNDNCLYEDIDLERMCGRAGIFFLPIMIDWAAILDTPVRGLLVELVDPVKQEYERIGLLELFADVYEYDTEEEDSLCRAWKEEFKGRVLTLI